MPRELEENPRAALDLARAVLDRVEEENPAFREKVIQAVQEALEGKTSPLTLDELRSAILDEKNEGFLLG